METNATRMCELLVGLPDVNVLAVDDQPGETIVVHIEARRDRTWCRSCGGRARVKDRPWVELVDLPCFGRPARLVWRKHRWHCPEPLCEQGSWTVIDTRIAAPRMALTDRAGRWVTKQVGELGRTVNEIAVELGCDSQTGNVPLRRCSMCESVGLTRVAIDASAVLCQICRPDPARAWIDRA